MEYLTYSKTCGFNIVNAIDEQDAEIQTGYDSVALEEVSEVDEVIIARVRDLIKDD